MYTKVHLAEHWCVRNPPARAVISECCYVVNEMLVAWFSAVLCLLFFCRLFWLVKWWERAEQLPDFVAWLGADALQLEVQLAVEFAAFQIGYRFGIFHGYIFWIAKGEYEGAR